MNWKKKGLIIEPQTDLFWMKTHAMIPTVECLEDNIYRVYFSGRNHENRSHIGYANVEVLEDEIKVLEYSHEAVLLPGELGCFDDSGVTPSSIVNINNKKYLYYIGWRARSTVRMELIGGLAISEDGKSFERYSKAPILNKNNGEPINILTAPFVIRDEELFKMWYVSGIRWLNPDLPQYDIKYAVSKNGLEWDQTGAVAIPLKAGENALARPYVIKEDGIYKMWYSYKKNKYQLGYAESIDGKSWTRRDDDVGIFPSEEGWDSDMIEYAAVFTHKGKRYMFYNGNEYGKYGIGYAVEE